jgi:aminopeptidase N
VGRPIHEKITNNSDIDSAFDTITYGKGGQVVSMVAGYLGDETFKRGVRLHMSRHPYGNATSDEFFGALADAAQEPGVLDAMKSFINKQGFPTVDFTHQGGWLVATQSRYARLGTTLDPQSWTIPLCLRQGEERKCFLMAQPQGTLGADVPGVLMPNAGGTGYYRFTLTPEDWSALIATGDKLPAGEGLAALDSLWGQFYAGKGQASQLIEAAKVFVNNKDSNVATGSADQFDELVTRGIIPEAGLPDYRRVMEEIYAPRLTALGFNPKAGAHLNDDPDTQKLRQRLVVAVSDAARDPAVRKQLLDAANAYLGGDKTALDQAFLARGLKIYVEEGHLTAAKTMFDRMLGAQDEVFRSAAQKAITSDADTATATWVFSVLNDARLRVPDKLALVGGLMNNAATRDMTYDWLKANYDSFSAGAGIFSAGRIASLPHDYCDAAKADEIDHIMRPKVIAAGRGELSFNRMLEDIHSCSVLKDAKSAEISAAFKDAK